MKYKKYTYYIILIFITLVGMWIIPSFVKKATDAPDDYPFVYFSSGLKELGIINYKDKQTPLSDSKGNKYTTAQFDSLVPLLNFRQLMSDGRQPDSIEGIAVTMPMLRAKAVNFRYTPRDRRTPDRGLYVMFESMPKRVGLEMPEDILRLKNTVEFIDVKTNTINEAKSRMFATSMEKAGFSFPAQWAIGNPNQRKPYDEGYFSLDSKGSLFHIKMVNGRPYVRDTHISEKIDIAWFSIYEAADKRFYGFLYDKGGSIYIVELEEGKYTTLKLDIEPVDLDADQVLIMGDLLYWTITVTTSQGRRYYGLEAPTLTRIDEHYIELKEDKWDMAAKIMFPYYLTFQNSYSDYIYPQVKYTGICGFGINVLLAIVAGVFISRRRNVKIFNVLYVLLTGIAGIIAIMMTPKN